MAADMWPTKRLSVTSLHLSDEWHPAFLVLLLVLPMLTSLFIGKKVTSKLSRSQ